MKTLHVVGIAAIPVLITLAIEESRIADLRARLDTGGKATVSRTVLPLSSDTTVESVPPVRTKSRQEASPAKAAEPAEESLARTARKMWDNPAGKSMMNQGAKMAVAMMYQDFIEGLDLSKEEQDYFKNLLGREVADQQELGMKMLGATPDQQKALAEEMKKRGEDAQAEIKKFLNDEEDFKSYTDYKSHLPERQHLDGIRATMSAKGAPLDAGTEAKLVDAMYRVRTESKAPDLSGPAAIDEMAKGNMVETYEKNWAVQQEALRTETGKFLNDTQMAAFQEYQQQAKEMQLMGLKMAEQMMGKKKDPAK